MGNSQTDHRTVWQIDGSLDKALAKGPASDDYATIVILNGTRDNLCRRGRIAVDEHDDLALGEESPTLGFVF